jgi:hypothetical protein
MLNHQWLASATHQTLPVTVLHSLCMCMNPTQKAQLLWTTWHIMKQPIMSLLQSKRTCDVQPATASIISTTNINSEAQRWVNPHQYQG